MTAPAPAADVRASVIVAGPPSPARVDDGANPVDFLGELARAMHSTVGSQHARISAELKDRRAEQVDALGARAASEARRLDTESKTQIGAIDAWGEAQIERVRVEVRRRIQVHLARHATVLLRQETIRDRQVSAIEAAIAAHEAQLEEFFERLGNETDPAKIGRIAASLPPAPDLADVAGQALQATTAEFAREDEAGPEASKASPSSAGAEAGRGGATGKSDLVAVMDPSATSGEGAQPALPWAATSEANASVKTSMAAPATDPGPA